MRKKAKELTGQQLADIYARVVTRIWEEVHQKTNKKEEEIYNEIPTILKDQFSGLYAELLHRLGYDEETIAKMLKEHKILNYQNEEEYFFTL